MRPLPNLEKLEPACVVRLRRITERVIGAADEVRAAEREFANARKRKWFGVIVSKLRAQAAPSGRCVYCSGSESSDVDHYRPKSKFPKLVLEYENFLWVCSICNRNKGTEFDKKNAPGVRIIHPAIATVSDSPRQRDGMG